VKATSSETRTLNTTVIPNCLKNWPTIPVIIPTGRNTATTVRVVAVTARPISAVASSAAAKGVFPIRMCRTMFSMTTMASSIKRPTDRDKAIRDMKLRVKFIAFMAKKVAIMEVGMASALISVLRQSRKKMKTIRTARRLPSKMVFRTSLTASRI